MLQEILNNLERLNETNEDWISVRNDINERFLRRFRALKDAAAGTKPRIRSPKGERMFPKSACEETRAKTLRHLFIILNVTGQKVLFETKGYINSLRERLNEFAQQEDSPETRRCIYDELAAAYDALERIVQGMSGVKDNLSDRIKEFGQEAAPDEFYLRSLRIFRGVLELQINENKRFISFLDKAIRFYSKNA